MMCVTTEFCELHSVILDIKIFKYYNYNCIFLFRKKITVFDFSAFIFKQKSMIAERETS